MVQGIAVRLIVRLAQTGQEVMSLYLDRADQAKLVADSLVVSVVYSHCYIVAVDYWNRPLFEVFPSRPAIPELPPSSEKDDDAPRTSRLGMAKVIPLFPKKR